MNIRKNKTRWIAAVLCAMMLMSSCALAANEIYKLYDESDEISTIQTALTKLDLYWGDITGHFGKKTETAVKEFQKRNDLTVDGVVGEDTLELLYKKAGIDRDSVTSSSSSSNTALLRYGSQNEAVRQLQKDLTALGYYSGTISGHFGSLTEAAVRTFQRKNGLDSDGVVGAQTLAKIESAKNGSSSSGSSSSGSSSSGSSSDSSSSSSSSSTLLKHGMKGSEAVKQLQRDLKTLGYYKSGSVTGNFGDLTKDAVFRFQRDNDLDADGVAGAKTLAKIQELLKKQSSGSSSSIGSSSSSGSSSSGSSSSGSSGSSSSGSSSGNSAPLSTSVTLSAGMTSEEVLKLQTHLKTLGYYSGTLSSTFGEKTTEAVIAYQKSKGLTADGLAGKKTLSAINADITLKQNSSLSLSERASKVIFANFSTWRRNYANGEYCTVFDFSTGYSWTLRILSKDAHMDAEPLTAEDTYIMYKAFGSKTTWTPKPVWVTFSDGKTYLGTTHNTPHESYRIQDNNFDGHLCVHFPRDMEDAIATGPYATSHQEAILEGWEATKKLMK